MSDNDYCAGHVKRVAEWDYCLGCAGYAMDWHGNKAFDKCETCNKGEEMKIKLDPRCNRLPDVYQARYVAHQERKKRELGPQPKLQRRSVRSFSDEPVAKPLRERILEAVRQAPSSCNRQAVYVREGFPAGQAEWDVLVGGKGWVKNAPYVLLFFADPLAYKAPGELKYMPIADGWACLMAALYEAQNIGLNTCAVCPNIRTSNLAGFNDQFNPYRYIFTGALAVGVHDGSPIEPCPKRSLAEVLYPDD